MKKIKYLIIYFILANSYALPKDFVYLSDIDPTILQDMRYAGYHNFLGRVVDGYHDNVCILTRQAATALKKVQEQLKPFSLSLKVYDCYRPVRAVADFIRWSENASYQEMKQEFYPHVDKKNLFKLGYVAKKSGHSRGSTIDLTIVPIPTPKEVSYHKGQSLKACTAPYHERFHDNSIDMGTGYDCMDQLSHIYNNKVNASASRNRQFLQQVMARNGFLGYEKEWWHFTLKNEPFPQTYFNFIVK